MGILTRVYKLNGDLAINIPSEALPDSSLQIIEERIETPGYEAETEGWYDAIIRPYKNRTAVLLTSNINISPAEAMSNLGLDPDKPIYIRPYNAKNWIKAHFYHGYYGRVWIPTPIARKTRMRNYTIYPFLIRGTTFPKIEIRHIRKEVRNVYIEHMGKTYPTENYAPNRYRWLLPKEIESYPVLMSAISMNIYPEAQCHLTTLKDVIQTEFIFTRASARVVVEKTGYAYRNMAVRNYTATVEVDYPFLCEIRATYLSCTPKTFYQSDPRHHILLKEALQITVYNMLNYYFNTLTNKETGEPLKHSTMSYADHIDKIDYTTHAVNLRRNYPDIARFVDQEPLSKEKKQKETYLNFTSESEGIPSEEFGIEEKQYYYCIKYIRVLNESSYKEGRLDRWVYTNTRIESDLLKKQEDFFKQGFRLGFNIDQNGFIWKE